MEKAENSVQIDNLAEGTYHQVAIGAQPKRKHFFSPLDPAYADAVHKDAETVEYTEEEEVCFTSLLQKLHLLMSCGRDMLNGRSIKQSSLWWFAGELFFVFFGRRRALDDPSFSYVCKFVHSSSATATLLS